MTRARGDAGASSVEFALVLPLLMMLLGIAAFFGWYVYVQAQLDRAAGRAARFAAVPTPAGVYSYCVPSVLSTVNAALVSEKATASEITLSDNTGPLAGTATCPQVPQRYVHVTVAHTFSNPFSSLVALLTPSSGTVTVTGDGQADVETP